MGSGRSLSLTFTVCMFSEKGVSHRMNPKTAPQTSRTFGIFLTSCPTFSLGSAAAEQRKTSSGTPFRPTRTKDCPPIQFCPRCVRVWLFGASLGRCPPWHRCPPPGVGAHPATAHEGRSCAPAAVESDPGPHAPPSLPMDPLKT